MSRSALERARRLWADLARVLAAALAYLDAEDFAAAHVDGEVEAFRRDSGTFRADRLGGRAGCR